MRQVDHIEAEAFSSIGETPVVVVDLSRAGLDAQLRSQGRLQAMSIGVDAAGALPAVDPDTFDVLITSRASALAPWVSISPPRLEITVAALCGRIRAHPIAAVVLCKVLRIGQALDWRDAIAVESMAYSMLLGGAEFRAWKAAQAPRLAPDPALVRVDYVREGDRVTLTLTNPFTRNATEAAMRDALCEALINVLEDPAEPELLLQGAGACFSVGGHLGEFGRAEDLALAHVVRTLRSPTSLLHELGVRARVRLQGACIGAGVEIAAAAATRVAEPGAIAPLTWRSAAGGSAFVAPAIGAWFAAARHEPA